jgi:hypothetical protein
MGASVDSFLGVICRHVATVADSLLETQSVHSQCVGIPSGSARASANAVAL